MKKNTKTHSTRDELREMRDALGWSARELARRSGVSPATVAGYLAGRCDVTTAKADAMRAAMARALGWADDHAVSFCSLCLAIERRSP